MSPINVRPENQNTPVGPLQKVIDAGLNPGDVPSCAIPEDGKIKGCNQADRCFKRFFSRKENGGFGPRSMIPGSGGEGWKYVAYFFRDSASLMEKEDFCRCDTFIATLGDKYENQDRTGDEVVILGNTGTQITVLETLPEKTKDGTFVMVSKNKVVTVPEPEDPIGGDSRRSYREELRRNRREIDSATRRSRAYGEPETQPEARPADDAKPEAGPTGGKSAARR